MTKQDLAPFRGVELPAFASNTFVRLQREIDRLFDDFGRGWDRAATPAFPKIDVSETDGEIEITAELPGMEQKDINVSLANDVLTVSGEKRTESEKQDKNYSLSERSYGAFSRSVALPAGVDPAAIKATVAKGVLKGDGAEARRGQGRQDRSEVGVTGKAHGPRSRAMRAGPYEALQ